MLNDVICLSHLRWGFVFQRPNHLMTRCARDRRVFFVEEPHLDDSRVDLEINRITPNLFNVIPHLPVTNTQRANDALQRALLDSLIERFDITKPLAWYYTPMALGYAASLETGLVVYDCMDELSGFQGAPPELGERERELLRRADLVFTGGESLFEAKKHLHPNIHAFPSSVDFDHFAQGRRGLPARAAVAEPEDQRDIPGPRLGFFGVIDERLDRDLIAALADSRPSYSIILLGPVVKIDPASLPVRPNLYYLGQKKYEALPAYLAGWDVALLPFALNAATRFISPTKTLEYLAAQKAIVSTPIHDVVHPYGDNGLVRIASDPETFASEVDNALAEAGTAAEAARRARAARWLETTSWDRTWERMNRLIEAAFYRRLPQPAQLSLQLGGAGRRAIDIGQEARSDESRTQSALPGE